MRGLSSTDGNVSTIFNNTICCHFNNYQTQCPTTWFPDSCQSKNKRLIAFWQPNTHGRTEAEGWEDLLVTSCNVNIVVDQTVWRNSRDFKTQRLTPWYWDTHKKKAETLGQNTRKLAHYEPSYWYCAWPPCMGCTGDSSSQCLKTLHQHFQSDRKKAFCSFLSGCKSTLQTKCVTVAMGRVQLELLPL